MANPTGPGPRYGEQFGSTQPGGTQGGARGGTAGGTQGGAGTQGGQRAGQMGGPQGESTLTRTAEQAWETTKRQAQQFGSTIGSSAEDAYGTASDFVSRYPIPCLLGAVGVGFLIGSFFNQADWMARRMSYSSDYPGGSSGGYRP